MKQSEIINNLTAPQRWLYNEIKNKGSYPIPNGSNLLNIAGEIRMKGLIIFRWDLNCIFLSN